MQGHVEIKVRGSIEVVDEGKTCEGRKRVSRRDTRLCIANNTPSFSGGGARPLSLIFYFLLEAWGPWEVETTGKSVGSSGSEEVCVHQHQHQPPPRMNRRSQCRAHSPSPPPSPGRRRSFFSRIVVVGRVWSRTSRISSTCSTSVGSPCRTSIFPILQE